MKKKIISMLMITSLSIALIGCGAEATYVNPVTGEAMDKEEQKELQEMRDELSKLEGYDEFEAEVLGNNNSASCNLSSLFINTLSCIIFYWLPQLDSN